MKLVAIMAIGGYWSPWFSYSIASVYNHVDELVVVNHGYNVVSNSGVSLGPLERATQTVKELDVNGKIVELTDIKPEKLIHAFPLGTQKAANVRRALPEGEGSWYDLRGLNYTAANEYAAQHGADWILMTTSDAVAYADLEGIKENIGTYAFHRVEFAGDVGGAASYLRDIDMGSMYIDTIQTYVADLDTWYGGGGAIAGHRPTPDGGDTHIRKPTDRFHCAHLRMANPAWLGREEKYQHFFGRFLFHLYTNDFGYFSEELFDAAAKKALLTLLERKKPEPVLPPEVCFEHEPLDYIRRGL